MCAVVSSALPQAHVVSPVYNFHFILCGLLQVNTCAWTVVTFRHLFVKVNNAYERFIAKSLSPFAASNNF